MRVKSSSFHCPSYCFCKPPPRPPLPSPQPPPPPPLPSSAPPQPSLPPSAPPPPLLPPPPQCESHTLQKEDSHHTSCRSFSGSVVAEEKLCDEKLEIGENGIGGKEAFLLKSSLKKTGPASKEIVKECVKWTDDLGKELVEIREFEPVESEELDDEIYGYPSCHCVIL